ncbi:diaminopimelate epimerase [Ornithinibacillus sp. L9]|uniref:Diaminopimelate epimerase n=1 Tax=Ornithinibacillus caprae TaxID=2678566 RepID=A0A6N8FPF4_9BACI|nr:diaminopimelate epimerase [Ornithinibacillus caprae]MUK90017.1 diaminopimelate epimerase [Ornithinibacillus caprae]
MEIPFIKMHGLGNNYIYLDLFQFDIQEELLPKLAQQVSNVNTGIGSDGLILIHPSKIADVGMRIFNKDGSEGMSCGNGLRCTAKYAYEYGIVDHKNFRIEAKAGVVEAEVSVNETNKVGDITINMGAPILNRTAIPMVGENDEIVINEPFKVQDVELNVTAVSMGNPHAVFFVERIEDAPLYEQGPVIEKDKRFPEGVNVEFVEVVSPNELNFRVWERGSGVTQACGTGACAAVVAATLNEHVRKNETITVHLQGGDLKIRWDQDGQVWMTGGAEIVATGSYHF